jgi:signal peptide peptidase SppA
MAFSDLFSGRFSRGLTIPVVRLHGAIAAGGSMLRPSLSLASAAGQLERAFSFRRSPVVAISVNSPGGSPVQSRLIHSRIRELADRHKKRVLVFVEDVAASGGYMIAMAGDEIIADETSIVGSIGVIAATFGFDKAIARIGVDRRVYTAGENKMMLDPFQPEKKKDIEHLKAMQAEIHQVFIDMVKKARGARLVDDPDLFTGKFWTGSKARELGLVDRCGLMAPVIAERYGEKARLRLVAPRRGLFGRAPAGVMEADAAMRAGQGFAASLPNSVLESAEEKALWSRYGL